MQQINTETIIRTEIVAVLLLDLAIIILYNLIFLCVVFYIDVLTCDIGGSYKSSCSLSATSLKSAAWKQITSFISLLPVSLQGNSTCTLY